MDSLLKRFHIFYEVLTKEANIIAQNLNFWSLIQNPLPKSPIHITDAFPEVIGYETDIQTMLREGKGELRLPGILRGDIYINLSVFFELNEEVLIKYPDACALIVIEDTTEIMQAQQVLVQGKNEITILTRQLEKKNTELHHANEQAEDLMQLVRNHNHELDVKVKFRTRDLHLSRLSVITTLARVAEFRDTDTGEHIYRIGRSCVLIGKELSLSAAELERLYYSSLLHDVGKIGIPDSILLKKGPLTTEEWEIMRTHTTLGANILNRTDIEFFSTARDIALYHHERWDGNGYPEGLSGTDIPLMSRICSVADVFDALLSNRSYKKSWKDTDAVEVIKKGAGKAFDPDVVDAFMKVLDSIISLRASSFEEAELLQEEFI